LHKIFHLSFQVSKKIRSQTCIAAGPRNIPSAAINMLDRKSGGVKMSKVLICGVNELTEILLKYLNRRGTTIILANRSLYQAQKLASGYEAKAVSLDAIDYWLSRVDAVFTATASTEYIITAKQLEKVRNKKEKLYLVDIAVPRNIDPEADKLPGVKLLDLQDLKKYLELSNSIRQEEVAKAEAMIEEQVNLYSLWRTKIMKQDKLLSLKQIINQTRKSELEKIKDRFRKGDLKALEAYSKAMTREFLRLAPYLWDEFELPARKEKS
jgi:glutamyl-tRNA reductase